MATKATGSLKARVFMVMPAAGVGVRMGGLLPKQYQILSSGRCVLEESLQRVLDSGLEIAGFVVAIGAKDDYFQKLPCAKDPLCISVVRGGATRTRSVASALAALPTDCNDNDWVLVHDSVRPLVAGGDIRALATEVAKDTVGGLLVSPVCKSVKRVVSAKVVQSVAREDLCFAETPQMFRAGVLRGAYEAIGGQNEAVDEAEVVARAGYEVVAVTSCYPNPKLTYAEDVALVEALLARKHG